LQLIDDGRFDYVEGSAVPQTGGGWAFSLEVTKYFSPSHPPNDAQLLSGLSFLPATLAIADSSYFDFINRLAPLVAFLKQIGAWFLPHPWVNLFLPVPGALQFVSNVLSTLTVDDVGQGPVLIYPCNRGRTQLFRLPDTPRFYLFSVLRNAIPPTPDRINALIQANRQLYNRCVEIGGKRYPIDSVPMDKHDWQGHYQPLWGEVVSAKRHFDPDNILTSGQGIFG
jgi:cytokinin dehydrogenase